MYQATTVYRKRHRKMDNSNNDKQSPSQWLTVFMLTHICHILRLAVQCHEYQSAALFYRSFSKLWAEAKLQSQPSTSCPITFYESILPMTPGGSKRSQINTMLPGTASTIGAYKFARSPSHCASRQIPFNSSKCFWSYCYIPYIAMCLSQSY